MTPKFTWFRKPDRGRPPEWGEWFDTEEEARADAPADAQTIWEYSLLEELR